MRSEVKGHGLTVGRGEKPIFKVPARAILGEVFCRDDILPKRSKVELEQLSACNEG